MLPPFLIALPTPSLTVGLPGPDALPYCLAAVTALAGWFGARSTAGARLQKTLLDASRQWVEQSQEERAHLTVRISELETELAATKLACLQQAGEIRGLKQYNFSLQETMKRAGIDVPPDTRGRAER